jgi:dsDNA-specific endonuclease/ATPase MutS2
VICTEEEKKHLGIDQLLQACVCRSPQGRALKERQDFYTISDREALREEFRAIAGIRASLSELAPQWRSAESILGRMRNVAGTVRGIENGRLVDESELFELKRCFSLLRQLGGCREALAAAEVRIKPQDEAEALLNPPGVASKGFHLYSAYSEELGSVRHRKHLLETQILRAQGKERQELLAERSLLVTEEGQEEIRQIRRLTSELEEHMEVLRENLHAAARLDFRLAKARLAESWQAPLPEITTADLPVQIFKAWHPLLRKNLEAESAEFTCQSIRLEKGSTVISGLNMGGKSVALETFLICLYLLQLGYCPPCEKISSPLFDFFVYMAENPGSAVAGLSSFGMEAARLREYFRLTESGRALLVMDEPCRGTNPHEATAIVRAICRIYAASDSCLLLATHYQVPAGKGIYHYQIRGLGDLSEEKAGQLAVSSGDSERRTSHDEADILRTACSIEGEDLEAVKRISELMDYRLIKVEDEASVPAGAIRIAELMGIDEKALSLMRDAYTELDR